MKNYPPKNSGLDLYSSMSSPSNSSHTLYSSKNRVTLLFNFKCISCLAFIFLTFEFLFKTEIFLVEIRIYSCLWLKLGKLKYWLHLKVFTCWYSCSVKYLVSTMLKLCFCKSKSPCLRCQASKTHLIDETRARTLICRYLIKDHWNKCITS